MTKIKNNSKGLTNSDPLIIRINNIFNCDVNSISRVRENVNGRVALGNFLRIKKAMSLERTGELINKTHATIIHYCKLHLDLYEYDKIYRIQYDDFIGFDFIDISNDYIERKIIKILIDSGLQKNDKISILEMVKNYIENE
jgi:hypothetical protein